VMKKLIAALAVAGTLVAAAPASAGDIDWTSNRDRGRATVRVRQIDGSALVHFVAETRAANPVALFWSYTCSNSLGSLSNSGRQLHSTVGGGWRDAVKKVRMEGGSLGMTCTATAVGVTSAGRRVEAFIGVVGG
jgi:hypothetical protein